MENPNLLLQSVTIFFLLVAFIQVLKRQEIFNPEFASLVSLTP